MAISTIKNFNHAVGYWAIGGLFALLEIALLYIFVDRLGFKAWLVATIWVFGGMVLRYEVHNWWFSKGQLWVKDAWKTICTLKEVF